MTLKEFSALKEDYERDGRQATGVRLTPDQARELRRELAHLYGQDPGERLTTLYGLEVLTIQADRIAFEG